MSRFAVIALDQLGPMDVLEKLAAENILAARMSRLKELWELNDPPAAAQYDVEVLEFDPLKINQETGSYFDLLLRDRINQAARAVTLAFAFGSDLDAIASRYPGGVPRLTDESDERYRRRIWLAPNALSPHGVEEAYAYWALTADPTIRDASSMTVEGTGNVDVYVMAEGADPRPSTATLLKIRAHLHDSSRKGMTDVVSVLPPKVINTNYKADVWLFPGPDATSLMAELRVAMLALVEKQRWLGYDHTLMAINGVLAKPGVQNIAIREPTVSLFADPGTVVKVNEVELVLRGRAE